MQKLGQKTGGKYREIILAVAFFLVFDLAVLVLNFYISFQLSADAVSINLSGRQRMLSQRMTKALFGLHIAQADGRPTADGVAELKLAANLFGETLGGFINGATVTGGAGTPQYLNRADTEKEQAILAEAQGLWLPFRALIDPVLADNTPHSAQVEAAVVYARDNNLKILKLMNDLTTELEVEAQGKANRLRMIQTAGIILALFNFLFILFKFIRRLRESDAATEAARQETSEIFATVREGLFLLDKESCIGHQFSASLHEMLGRSVAPGDSFIDFLRQHLSATEFNNARDFIGLLFSDRVLEDLMGDLNPLARVEIGSGKEKRYLSFQFNQVHAEGADERRLLVTAQDITEQTTLAMELDTARLEAKNELTVLLDLLNISPALLGGFLKNAHRSLSYVNQQLEKVGKGEHRQLVEVLFRHIHTLKGEAATLGLDLFEQTFQTFEGSLRSLRDQSMVNGEDLLILMPHLEASFARVQQVEKMIERLSHFQNRSLEADGTVARESTRTEAQSAPEHEFLAQVAHLAERIARDEGKDVRVEADDLSPFTRLNERQRQYLRDIIVQCVRNAVVHGIEAPAIRHAHCKPEQGLISLRLFEASAGEMLLECRDDGQGLDPERIRESLVRSGRVSPEAARSYTAEQLIGTIFESGVSTAAEAGRDAGQGVGLAIVKEHVAALGGRLRLSSRPQIFTTFGVRFPI